MTKLRTLRWEDYAGLSRWPIVITRVLIGGRQEDQRHSVGDMTIETRDRSDSQGRRPELKNADSIQKLKMAGKWIVY